MLAGGLGPPGYAGKWRVSNDIHDILSGYHLTPSSTEAVSEKGGVSSGEALEAITTPTPVQDEGDEGEVNGGMPIFTAAGGELRGGKKEGKNKENEGSEEEQESVEETGKEDGEAEESEEEEEMEESDDTKEDGTEEETREARMRGEGRGCNRANRTQCAQHCSPHTECACVGPLILASLV